MRRNAALGLGVFALSGCANVPFDYASFQSRVSTCYFGVTPDDVTTCLDRENIKDPAYPMAFKPGSGAFCSPDLTARECRDFLESANEPSIPLPQSNPE